MHWNTPPGTYYEKKQSIIIKNNNIIIVPLNSNQEYHTIMVYMRIYTRVCTCSEQMRKKKNRIDLMFKFF